MSKLTRKLVANAMLSSIENYLFEILDSVQHEIGELTAENYYTLNSWVRGSVEKSAAKLEASNE